MPPSMGTVHSALIKGNPRGGQTEPGSGCAVPGQYSSRRMETKSPRGSKDLVCLLEGRGGPPQKTTFTYQYISRKYICGP